jgi:hypothetical protein
VDCVVSLVGGLDSVKVSSKFRRAVLWCNAYQGGRSVESRTLRYLREYRKFNSQCEEMGRDDRSCDCLTMLMNCSIRSRIVVLQGVGGYE